MKVAFCALGCKVNQYEIDCYARLFREKGYEVGTFEEKCDVYVINTCSVTNTGDKKSRQMLRRAKKLNPEAVVAATGCYAQVKSEDVKAMAEVDVIIGTANRHMIVEMVEAAMRGEKADVVADIMRERLYEELECDGVTERTRAYIKIEDGCDNFCSYCIIPYARGPVRSRKMENIIAEATHLSQKGFCEIVLTGISVSSYGKDTGGEYNLSDVIENVSKINGVERIRLSSIDTRIFTDDFISKIAENKKMCRHFHISLQSGSDSVLKRMNRKYTTEEYFEIVKKLRAAMPDVAITTDIICGFPGETEEEFRQTEEFVKKTGFARVHIFPYSEREGTRAAMMEQLPKQERERRAALLSETEEVVREAFEESFTGKKADVLFEQTADGFCEGLTDNYLRVFVKSETPLDGNIRSVMITKRENGKLFGDLL